MCEFISKFEIYVLKETICKRKISSFGVFYDVLNRIVMKCVHRHLRAVRLSLGAYFSQLNRNCTNAVWKTIVD